MAFLYLAKVLRKRKDRSRLVRIVIQQSFAGDEFHFNFFISCAVEVVECFVRA